MFLFQFCTRLFIALPRTKVGGKVCAHRDSPFVGVCCCFLVDCQVLVALCCFFLGGGGGGSNFLYLMWINQSCALKF